MRRSCCRRLLVTALLAITAACSDDGATSTVSSIGSPSGGIITETFTGRLTLNAGASFPFSSATSGSITATLTTFTPDTTLPVGLWVGVWDGTKCTSGVVNDKAVQGSGVPAFAPSAGNWCVRIYDSLGNVPQPETYQIEVTHP